MAQENKTQAKLTQFIDQITQNNISKIRSPEKILCRKNPLFPLFLSIFKTMHFSNYMYRVLNDISWSIWPFWAILVSINDIVGWTVFISKDAKVGKMVDFYDFGHFRGRLEGKPCVLQSCLYRSKFLRRAKLSRKSDMKFDRHNIGNDLFFKLRKWRK